MQLDRQPTVDRDLREAPNDITAEQAFLGSAMNGNGAIARSPWLEPEDFHEPVHGRIFTALRREVAAGRQASAGTIGHLFGSDQALIDLGGSGYVRRLEDAALTVINPLDYARVIKHLSRKRQLVAIADELREAAMDGGSGVDPVEIIGALRKRIEAATNDPTLIRSRGIQDVVDEIVRDLDQPAVRWSTGIPALDESLGGGVSEGYVIGIEARPKSFKTGTAHTLTVAAAAAGVPVHYFALEMGGSRLVRRMLGHVGRFNSASLKHRDATAMHLVLRAREAMPDCITIDDCPGLTFDRLRAAATQHVLQRGTKVFVLDYWQLVRPSGRVQNQAAFLDEVAQWCADHAKEHQATWLIAGQQNREGFTRGSDGLIMACDWHAVLHKHDVRFHDPRLGPVETIWMDVKHARDGIAEPIGTAEHAVLMIDPNGPHLAQIPGSA